MERSRDQNEAARVERRRACKRAASERFRERKLGRIPKVNYNPAKRLCLRCGLIFRSEGPHNRICERCSRLETICDQEAY